MYDHFLLGGTARELHKQNPNADELTDLIDRVVSGAGDRAKDRDRSRLADDRDEVVFDSRAETGIAVECQQATRGDLDFASKVGQICLVRAIANLPREVCCAIVGGAKIDSAPVTGGRIGAIGIESDLFDSISTGGNRLRRGIVFVVITADTAVDQVVPSSFINRER